MRQHRHANKAIVILLGALALLNATAQAEERQLDILSPAPGQRVNQLDTVVIAVKSNRAVATRTVMLSVNGTVLQTLATPAPWERLSIEWPVGTRAPGVYALRVSALAAGGARLNSAPVQVVVTEAPWYPAPRERSYALLVGVGQYQDTGITSLSYSVADVKAVYRALTDPAAGAYPPENVVMLTDDSPEERKPTRSNILDLLKNWLGKVGQGADAVTFYFSGHGIEEDGKGYLVPRDARIGLLADTGVDIGRVNELLQQTGARVKLLIVDACHSAAGKSVRVKMPDAVANGLFMAGEGRATLASCKEDQQSWEWPEKGQSVFTYYLAEALQGKADANRDRQVTLDEAFQYVHRRVTEWATDNRKQQVPRLKADVSGEVVLTGLTPGKDAVRRPGLVALKPPAATPAPAPTTPQAEAAPAPLPATTATVRFYVSRTGNDRWSGKLSEPSAEGDDGPFATLERARNAVRALKEEGPLPKGGVSVVIRGGLYERTQPFELGPEDSGEEGAPVQYLARKGEQAILVGGKVLTDWQPVTDPTVLERLDATARGKVLQCDLRAQGITDYGQVAPSGAPTGREATTAPLELFFQDRPMALARWPNEGFAYIAAVPDEMPVQIHGRKGDKSGRFTYEGDRPQRWGREKDLCLHGYWFWDWAEQRQKVASIDVQSRQITLAPPLHTYGYRKGQWYYALNALSELDRPEEWYLDRETGILYFWPPAPLDAGRAIVSVTPTLVACKDASHVAFRGLRLEASRCHGVTLEGGQSVAVVGCVLRNHAGWGIRVTGGTSHAVTGCDIHETGCGGISLDGGDRATLTPAGHLAENNHIHHYARLVRTYQPAISLSGVGNRALRNLIHDAPHMAVGFSGNDHLIEGNEIHSVCYEANDVGAIYTGRDWSMWGTTIQHNYLHDIRGRGGAGGAGVYLDDQFSGVTIRGNLFARAAQAILIGGGRDCSVDNNVFVDCSVAVRVDARGLGWAAGGHGEMAAALQKLPYKSDVWARRYPRLATLLDDEPMAPKGNVISRNICVGGKWEDVEAKAAPFLTHRNNLIEGDPCFADPARGDFRLRPESPALRLGFQPIPFERVGLYPGDDRASWPVANTVRVAR